MKLMGHERALGGSNSNPTPKGKCDEVEVQYPLALAKALIEASKSPAEHVCHVVKIRFLLITGALSVRDQTKNLWILEERRKARVCSLLFGTMGVLKEC
jgi:hypothetical protein